MSLIYKEEIANGIFWVAIEAADLRMVCGCPADTVKHLKNSGHIQTQVSGFETGPNVILLSDILIQHGQVSNLAEFPVLHMLYMQGMNLPDHPSYGLQRPLLVGQHDQLNAQLKYISVGYFGLESKEEMIEAGIDASLAEKIYDTKLHYFGGENRTIDELVDVCPVGNSKTTLKNKVFIRRRGVNIYEISYQNEKVEIDLNLQAEAKYTPPYQLPFKNIEPGTFSIIHSGEGNGWDVHRPCMASVIQHRDKKYLIDAGPNILSNLAHLGIGLSEIDGVFLSHIHDDHFAGVTELLNEEHKLNFYATPLIRKAAEKKLLALTGSEVDLLHLVFNCVDLQIHAWNDIDGLQVMPNWSPHTVETTTFLFRFQSGKHFKTYQHLSDAINFKEFKNIIADKATCLTNEDFNAVRQGYLTKVDLKKVDVGGGIIHGHIEDYLDDRSKTIVLAHTSKQLDIPTPKFVNVGFGDVHNLQQADFQVLLQNKAAKYLSLYLGEGYNEQVMTKPHDIVHYAPGEEILNNTEHQKIALVIQGLVRAWDNQQPIEILDAGNIFGYAKPYFLGDLPARYKAFSHTHILMFKAEDITGIIAQFQLAGQIRHQTNMLIDLKKSSFFHEGISIAVLTMIAKFAKRATPVGELNEQDLNSHLCIITNGWVQVAFEKGRKIKLNPGEHFGGKSLLKDIWRGKSYGYSKDVEVIMIPAEVIEKIPLLLWKIFEIEEKRYQYSVFN